jgi:uncharacterized protein
MRRPSWSIVGARIWTFDRDSTLARLRAWARDLGRDPQVLAVVLFGSMARGDATAASDADVFVLLRSSTLDFDERVVRIKPLGLLPAGVDVFPYTTDEAEDSAREGWGVVRVALREGLVLYERQDALATLTGVER